MLSSFPCCLCSTFQHDHDLSGGLQIPTVLLSPTQQTPTDQYKPHNPGQPVTKGIRLSPLHPTGWTLLEWQLKQSNKFILGDGFHPACLLCYSPDKHRPTLNLIFNTIKCMFSFKCVTTRIVTVILHGPLCTACWKNLKAVLRVEHLLLCRVSTTWWDLPAHHTACLSFIFPTSSSSILSDHFRLCSGISLSLAVWPCQVIYFLFSCLFYHSSCAFLAWQSDCSPSCRSIQLSTEARQPVH